MFKLNIFERVKGFSMLIKSEKQQLIVQRKKEAVLTSNLGLHNNKITQNYDKCEFNSINFRGKNKNSSSSQFKSLVTILIAGLVGGTSMNVLLSKADKNKDAIAQYDVVENVDGLESEKDDSSIYVEGLNLQPKVPTLAKAEANSSESSDDTQVNEEVSSNDLSDQPEDTNLGKAEINNELSEDIQINEEVNSNNLSNQLQANSGKTEINKKPSVVAPTKAVSNSLDGEIKSIDSGKSVKGNQIKAYIATNSNINKGKKILLIGAIHGLEGNGKGIIDIIMQEHKKDPSIIGKNKVIMIPVLNPDAFQKTRTNANGVDLNRNFPTADWGKNSKYNPGPKAASEPETQFVMSLIEQYKPDLIINLHTPLNVIYYRGDVKDLAQNAGKLMNYPVSRENTPGSLETYAEEQGTSAINVELPSKATSPKAAWTKLKDGFVYLLNS